MAQFKQNIKVPEGILPIRHSSCAGGDFLIYTYGRKLSTTIKR